MKKIFVAYGLVFVVAGCVLFFTNYTIVTKTSLNGLNSHIYELEAQIAKLEKSASSDNKAKSIHPIEEQVQNCMKSHDYTTSAMIGCVDKSRDDWKKEIDKNMELLKNTLPKDKYTLLEKSHKNWLMYQDSEIAALEEIFSWGPPEMVRFFKSGWQSKILEDRAKTLSDYYNFYVEYK